MRDLGASVQIKFDPEGALKSPSLGNSFTRKDAELEVEEATLQGMKEDSRQLPSGSRIGQGRSDNADEEMSEDITPPGRTSGFTFPNIKVAPPLSHPSDDRAPPASGSSTPRRRTGAPGAIPNFPSATAARDPPPFFDSPSTSPPQMSPISSPPSRSLPTMRLPPQPFANPSGSSTASPWLALAAASGAPTPSLEAGPGGPGRSSPHLGYPFERLNIGGSWSGANLWGEGLPARRGSDVSLPDDGLRSSPTQPKDAIVPHQPTLNSDTLARYRAMTGHASAVGKGKGKDDSQPIPSGLSTSPNQRSPLPAALARRRGSLPKNVLDGVLSPPLVIGSKAPSPLASSTSSPSPAPVGLQPISTSHLSSLIARSTSLVLDLRAPSAFQSSHISTSHSIPIPSTLLRRPAFNLQKIAQMLSPASSEALSRWREKSDIVLIDADTINPSQSSILHGLAGKFEREGYHGRLWFVKGGLNAISNSNAPLLSDEDEDNQEPSGSVSGGLGNLDRLAFSQASTGSNLQNSPTSSKSQTPGAAMRSDPFADTTTSHTERPSLFNKINVSSRGHEESGAVTKHSLLSQKAPKLQPANPFFDNIRQNLELSHGGGQEGIALDLSPTIVERAQELPPWLSELVTMNEHDSAERLAGEFFRVELGEQKRLQAVMDWHSSSSGNAVVYSPDSQRELDARETQKWKSWTGGFAEGDDYFPFSITAGVERGTKNRYKNIWPYDFSRVRLDSPPEDEGDYINASFVQPKGTARRYIATQGPLDATYRDFWTLIWEQGVRVVVMLTKQYEGGLMKCGNYWKDVDYGPIRVELVSQTGGEDAKPSDVSGFDFGMGSNNKSQSSSPNIQRIFMVTRKDRPDAPPRKIIQLQCTCWPDFDVPESPDVLLNLMKDVDAASEETCVALGDDRADHPPVLVHCSAGVGRTGTFIIVDAIVDVLRNERKRFGGPSRDRSLSVPGSPGSKSLHDTYLPDLPQDDAPRPILVKRDDSNESLGGRSGKSTSSGQDSPLSTTMFSAVGSGDSTKSVSFLVPPPTSTLNPNSSDTLPTVFSTSPSPLDFPGQKSQDSPKRKANHPRFEGSEIKDANSKQNSGSSLGSRVEVESMDVDNPETYLKRDNVKKHDSARSFTHDMFNRHRGTSVASIDSEPSGRRPSLVASNHDSSDNLQTSMRTTDLGNPMPITKSNERHQVSSPVTQSIGLSPVAQVLEAMRIQRMSLVQSLRQYLFVHKAILQGYLNLVDEDRHSRERTTSSESAGGYGSGGTPARQRGSSSTDDDSNPKRRASPTELLPENPDGRILGASSLSKRPSFKKMRPAIIPEITSTGGEEGERGPRRKRQNSKLGREE